MRTSIGIIKMQTLGLSSKPQPADNIFKRLFWPAIESQYDVDLLGEQGFWICTVVAVLSLVLTAILGTPISGAFTALVFFLGGCGVRPRSVAAAALVFCLYLVNFVGGIAIGSFGNPGARYHAPDHGLVYWFYGAGHRCRADRPEA